MMERLLRALPNLHSPDQHQSKVEPNLRRVVRQKWLPELQPYQLLALLQQVLRSVVVLRLSLAAIERPVSKPVALPWHLPMARPPQAHSVEADHCP
jgi:hypothetical protein